MEYKYNNIVKNLSKQFAMSLNLISTVYNFDNGEEFEIAICETLRKFLPLKYGITRGFVVNGYGETAGDDIIIFDQQKYPTLRFLDKNNYARKEQIPVEAVYAYIEAKNSIDDITLKKAITQTAKVKSLCYKRLCIPKDNIPAGEHYIFSNKYNIAKAWEPIIKNPVYTMIISRNVRKDRTKISNTKDINCFLVSEINKNKELLDDNQFYNPECIVAGESNIAICGHYHFDTNGKQKETIELTKFYTGKRPLACYQVNEHRMEAYGLALTHLIMAINNIELADMPWDSIFNSSKMPDEFQRNKAMEDIND